MAKPSDTPRERRQKRPGRLRQAWQALMGAPVVPEAIRAEWVTWQFELEDLCDKLSNIAKKLQMRDRRELEAAEKQAQVDEQLTDIGNQRWAGRAAIRRRMEQQAQNGQGAES